MDSTELELPVFASSADCVTEGCGRHYVCRDCVPEEWRDIEYAEEWFELGLTPADAQQWAMDPMVVEKWMAAGVGVLEAHLFDDLAIEVDEAREWRHMGANGFALGEACYWLGQRGFDNNDALDVLTLWAKAGFSINEEDVYLHIEAGVRPHEREGWYREALEMMAGLLRPTRSSSTPIAFRC